MRNPLTSRRLQVAGLRPGEDCRRLQVSGRRFKRLSQVAGHRSRETLSHVASHMLETRKNANTLTSLARDMRRVMDARC